MPTKRTKEAAQAHDARQPILCNVPKCGRPRYAKGFCQTHHRQLLTKGTIKPIRPYRRRSPETVKCAGLRLSPACAENLEEQAERQGLSLGAIIADILENALVKPRQPGARTGKPKK